MTDTFRKLTFFSAIAAIAFGVIGLASWLVAAPALFAFRSTPATAFMLCGFALALMSATRSKWLTWLARASAATVAVACAASILLTEPGSASSGVFCDNPFLACISTVFGTMSLYDITGFGIISLAILLTDVRIRQHFLPSEWLALVSFLVAVMATIGSLFEQSKFCLFVSCQELSLLAVAVYAVLSAGVLLSRTDTGFMNLLESPGAGGAIARRILPGAFLIPVLLGSLRMIGLKLKVYDSEGALTMAVSMMIVAFLVLVWICSARLEKKDQILKNTLKTLAQSEQRVRTIINESVDAFVAIDNRGTIREFSQRAEAMFGWLRADVVDKEALATLAHGGSDGMLNLFEAADDNGASHLIETQCARKDGSAINVEIMPFLITSGSEQLCCAFVRDVTERRQLQQRFQDFYHAVSHELRSPLTAIRCALDTVKESDGTRLADEAQNQLHRAIASSDRLIALVNDLLDLRRIELGKFTLDNVNADPLILAQTACDALEPLCKLRSIEIIAVAESVCEVQCDPDRIVQVLINLLTNALKFSPEGSQIVLQTSDSGTHVRFAVIDAGPGIPEQKSSALFESFEQLQTPGWEYMPGSGLGLAICRRIIEEMGGSIGHHNNDGGGSTFWFELGSAEEAKPQNARSDDADDAGIACGAA